MSGRITTGNWILDALPDEEFQNLEAGMDRLELVEKETLLTPDRPGSWTYFPTSGVISFLREFHDGSQIEVGVVGREGMAGLHMVLESNLESLRAVVQCRGTVCRVDSDLLLAEFRSMRTLHRLLLRFTFSLLSQISLTAACNQLHTVDQRLARWLLAMGDRMDSAELHLSHEFLASMLGTGRARVTESIGRFRDRGGLSGGRGRIIIADRLVLKSESCECYEDLKALYESVGEASSSVHAEDGTVSSTI